MSGEFRKVSPELLGDVVERVRRVGGRADVQLLEDHLVLRQRPGLVGQQVGHAAELLRDGGGPGAQMLKDHYLRSFY